MQRNYATRDQLRAIASLLDASDFTEAEMLAYIRKHFGCAGVGELSGEQAYGVIDWLNGQGKAAA